MRGVGKSGKRWEAHIFDLDEVWRADLDGNGTQDYVFFGSGPYLNGRTTPPYSISILLMDREGVPVPFFATMYHGENGVAIKHLVDLNHDGHAELLIGSYDENVSDPRVGAFCSGHWTTQLYRFKDFGAEEIRGTMGGISFPFVRDWTYRGTQCAEEEKPFLSIQSANLYEHGTTTPGDAVTKIRKWSDGGLPEIDQVAGCKTVNAEIVVYDRSQIREIGFPSLVNSYAADLTDTVRRNGARVELRGINKRGSNGGCSVNLMWAK